MVLLVGLQVCVLGWAIQLLLAMFGLGVLGKARLLVLPVESLLFITEIAPSSISPSTPSLSSARKRHVDDVMRASCAVQTVSP